MTALFLSSLIYLSLITGGLIPPLAESDVHYFVRIVFLLGLLITLLRFGINPRTVKLAFVYAILSSLLLVPFLFFTSNYIYASQKIESVILGVGSSYLLLSILVNRSGWIEYKRVAVYFAIGVLFVTVLYKVVFGFWDREIRFFLNGPIVFGWLMGMHALLSISLWLEESRKRFLIFYIIFFVAVIWTQSKGPLLALCVSSVVLFVIAARRSPKMLRGLIVGFALIAGIVASQFNVILGLMEGSRLQSISALITGDTSDNDQGSIGSRGEMLGEAIDFISSEAPLGIGLAEWPNKSKSGADYPHNEHIEILVELGLPWFILHIMFIAYAFSRSSLDRKMLMLFFFIASSFSGDISYLRYLYMFALASIEIYGINHSRAASWRSNETSRLSS